MRKLSQKEIMLLLLLAGLCAVGYYQYNRLTGAGGATPAEAARAAFKEIDTKDLPKIVPVPLDDGAKVEIRKNSRNLFNYSKSPSEVYEEARQRREQARLQKEAEDRRLAQLEEQRKIAQQEAERNALHPPPEPPPAIPFKFIGKMGEPKA